jgi:tetratricopeptide (TPR) repeat protein
MSCSRRFIGLAALLLLTGLTCAADPTAPLREALALFNSGRYQDCFTLVSQYVNDHPDSATAHKLLGMDQYMLGHPKEALAEVTRATQLAPADADARYYLGRLYFSADNAPAALDAFKETIALDPSSVRAHAQLGQTYEALGRFSEAEAAYRTAIRLENDQPKKSGWPDYNLGVLLLNDGRTAEAVKCFRQALQCDSKFPEAKIKLAEAISKNEPVPEAFDLLYDAIRLDPQNSEAHYRLAVLLSKSGKREEAKEQFALFQKFRKH